MNAVGQIQAMLRGESDHVSDHTISVCLSVCLSVSLSLSHTHTHTHTHTHYLIVELMYLFIIYVVCECNFAF